MLTRRRAMLATAFTTLFVVPLAVGPARAQQSQPRLKAIATFSILGDFVKNVGGDRIEVGTLVGANGNAHVYAPSPADAKKVAEANIVFVNGLGFEGWLERLVKASGTKAPIVVATKGIKPRERAGGHDHDHGRADPHAWQSVANAKVYVTNIRDALIAADPSGKAAYDANAAAYLAKLDALEREVRDTIARVPADRRRVITSHDSFGYFEGAYGVVFTAPQGVSTEAEASAKDVADRERNRGQDRRHALLRRADRRQARRDDVYRFDPPQPQAARGRVGRLTLPQPIFAPALSGSRH